MNNLENKSKEFLSSIAKIKRLVHKHKKSKDFYPMMMITLKTINESCENNKYKEDYYGIKTSDLTNILSITKPSTSKMLNLLEEEQYIERFSNKNDRRVVYVKITEEGKIFLKNQNDKFENFICNVIDKMGEEDTDNLIRLFGRIYDVIEEIQEDSKKND